ncbi:hypothetical protein B0F88_10811 [Methylobacter tundripaludum]|uniref:Uncharacterized protein n=1 Tax=Methylobacter tundripaludum TaxID=173365 RepID=A0A2S6GZQ8_9GAMM|nr:hypothetical protein B0F88_10811 [Methylobacter tundripaludum]
MSWYDLIIRSMGFISSKNKNAQGKTCPFISRHQDFWFN